MRATFSLGLFAAMMAWSVVHADTIEGDLVPIVDISGETARQTVIAAGTAETYQGHPTTLLADDGKTLFCVWTIGHGGPCGPMARSDDGGRTWTRLDGQLPSVYRETHYNCPTLQKIVGPDGKVRYFVFSAKRTPRAALAILMSEDLGRTWKELPCAPHISAGMPPTAFMPLKDGTCALFGQVRTDPNVKTDRPTDDQDVWMSISKDGGCTWGPMRTVAHAKNRNLCEPCCVRSPDGNSLALIMRENRHKGRSMMCFSHDEGATWTTPIDTAWALTGDRHEAVLLPDGRYVICFRDQAIGSETRGQYMAWVGTWDDLVNARPGQCRIHLLKHHGRKGKFPGGLGDTGYSGVERLPDGTVVCTTYTRHFDDERQSSVVSTRFRISEIDAKLKEAASDYAKYVDVFTGTAGTGHTTPAAAVPFGMVQAGPDSGNRNWAYCSGYQYNDQTVIGYSQTHLSGTGCTDMGDVQILPFTGAYSVRPAYRAVDKSRECGEPGYYATVQNLDALKVEITATKHVGYYRITSLAGRPIKVLFDPNAGCSAGWGTAVDRDITCDVSNPGKICGGYVRSSWVKNRPMFYVIAFSRPWTKIERQEKLRSDRQDAYVAEFGADELLVRVALSQTSSEAAAANMAAETDGRGFDGVRADARAAWNTLFARSTAEGDETQLKNWYTSLYHLYFQPNDFADVGAEPRFTTLSLWDTFRAAQPWYTIAVPEIVVPEIKSMLGLYRKFGNLPRMSYGGGYVDCMIGEHILPVIADAYAKGFRGFDERLALEAMVKTVTEPHKGRTKENWEVYEKYGYLPFDLVRHESCSRTLEQCFDDWCLAKYAEALGETEIAAKFFKRADNWKNIFDTSIGFARGKDSKGKWLEPFDPYAFGHETTVVGCFTEGNSFQYSWHVLHDLDGLMSAMGGRERMEKNLDGLFTAQDKEGFRSCDITGLIGQYVHGNEPSHHVIYFYPQIGRPDKAAERIRDVFDRFYFPGPEGLSGNDDCGQMSAWYVFSAMGFYPFNPCGGEYVIGAPQLPQATLRLPNGKVFSMTAKNLSKENKHVKSVTLNGKPLDGWAVRHADVIAGGELVFEMGK